MKRIYWIDAARAIAILMVVLTHCHEQMEIDSILFKSVLYSIDRIGVPIFLMISGGLVLPGLESKPAISFYKKRIPQFLFLILFYTTLTNVVGMVFVEGKGVVESALYSIENLNGLFPSKSGYASHMWFMYTITGLYIIAPYLAKMLSACSTKSIIGFVAICLLFNYIPFFFNEFSPSIDTGIIKRIGSEFTGGYLVYMIVGYLIINRGVLDKYKTLTGIVMCISAIAIGCIVMGMEDVSRGKVLNTYHWYSASIFIFIMSIATAALFKWLLDRKENRVLVSISKFSFGIYLLHYAVLLAIKPTLQSHVDTMPTYIYLMILFSAVTVISYLLVRIISAIPFGKYLTQ